MNKANLNITIEEFIDYLEFHTIKKTKAPWLSSYLKYLYYLYAPPAIAFSASNSESYTPPMASRSSQVYQAPLS